MTTPTIAFLFPGQGSQTVGMGRELAEKFPVARQTFEEADEALGFSLSRLCFEGPAEQLRLTEFTQPAIYTASVATLRVLAEHGVKPAYVAGHSLGEYSANVAAGALDFADGARTVRHRGRFMQEAVPEGQGAMAAILGAGLVVAEQACREAATETGQVVAPANMNSLEQTVISGATAAVERAAALAKQLGARKAVMLHVSAPFHCSMMQPAQDRLAELLRTLTFRQPQVPVITNVDAVLMNDAEGLRDALIRQVTGAVRWTESMRLLIDQRPTHFVEVGPGKVLTGLLRQIDRTLHGLHVEDTASLEKTLVALQEAPVGETTSAD